MTLRPFATLFALALVHCNHDPSVAPLVAPAAVTPAEVAPVAPVVTAPTVTPPGTAPWALISHGGRRFAVLRAEVPADELAGPAQMVERAPHAGPVVFAQRPSAASIPEALRTLEGAAVLLHDRDGSVCRATLSAPTVLTRYDAEDQVDTAWDGLDEEGHRAGSRATDAHVMQEVATSASESDRLLVAELSATGCEGARWAHDERRAVNVFHREDVVGREAAAAVAAFRASPAWDETQTAYREAKNDAGDPTAALAPWDASDHAPVVQRWTSSRGGHRFVTVRAEIPNEGCGAFSASQWAVFEETDRGLVRRTDARVGADFVATEAVDVDGDGTPEFIAEDGVAQVGASGIERTLDTTIAYRGCSC